MLASNIVSQGGINLKNLAIGDREENLHSKKLSIPGLEGNSQGLEIVLWGDEFSWKVTEIPLCPSRMIPLQG